MNLTISRESSYLILICVADMILTVGLLASGLAREANPLMAYFIDRSYLLFCLVKLGTLVPAVLACELYRKHNPVFVRRILRFGIVMYLGLYTSGIWVINCA